MTTATLTAPETVKKAGPYAVLPVHLLHIAAQFASDDECKRVLQNICLSTESGIPTLYATDGHRAIRIRLPDGVFMAGFSSPFLNVQGNLLINAKAFKKRPYVSMKRVTLFNDGKATVHSDDYGCHHEASIDWRPTCTDQFPNIDPLMPDSYHNKPAASFGFAAAYLLDIFKVAEKYGTTGTIRFNMNDRGDPTLQTFSIDANWLWDLSADEVVQDVEIEHLLMPVLLHSP